jgi:hypothetical protein
MAGNQMTEEELKKHYDETANDPIAWLDAANENLIAADVIDEAMAAAQKRQGPIEHAMRLTWKSRMLRAYAVECLLKAIYVKNGNKLGDGGELDKGAFPTNHNLVSMWRRVCLPSLTPERQSLLMKLSHISTSLGRYPIAMRYDKPKPDVANNSQMAWTTSEDQALATIMAELKTYLPRPRLPYP